MNTTSKGFRKYDPTIDKNVNVAQWIVDDSTHNMDLANKLFVEQDEKTAKLGTDYKAADIEIETKLNNKLTLDSVSKSNFNFIAQNVEQDGLVEYFEVNTGIRVTKNTPIDKYFLKAYVVNLTNSGWIISSLGRFGIRWSSANGKIEIANSNTGSAIKQLFTYNGGALNIAFWQTSDKPNEYGYYCNGECGYIANNDFSYSNQVYAGRTEGHVGLSKCVLYNRILSPQEIQQNFTILNNSQAISEVHTKDAQGNVKKFAIATDSHHVATRGGRTQDKINQVFYSQNCKDFVADSTGKISVNNGLEGYVSKAEITGQTVKNVFARSPVVVEGSDKITINNIFLSSNKGFSLKNTTDKKIFIQIHNCVTDTWVRNASINPAEILNITSDNECIRNISGTFANGWTLNDKEVLKSVCIIVPTEQISYYTSYIPFGLTSTQAIISNNWQSYEIYESMIYGKTRILKAPKGTQNWVEINADETRDTVTYDYKLDSLAGDLGSVPSVVDYADRARKVKVVKTKDGVLNGTEGWADLSGTYAVLTISDMATVVNSQNDFLFSSRTDISGRYNQKQLVHTYSSGENLQLFKQSLATNPTMFKYILATPQQTSLTDEEFKAYDAFKKLILCHKVGDVADTFEIKEDGSGISVTKIKNMLIKDQTWTVQTTLTNTIQASFTENGILANYGICDNMPVINDFSDVKHFKINLNSVFVHILKSDIGYADGDSNIVIANKIKTYFNNNPYNLFVALAIPIVTTLDKSITPTIQTADKINSLFVDSPVAPSSFTASLPTTDNIAKEFTLTPMNLWTGIAKANLLKNGDAELILNVTAPSPYNTHITTLPESCRPKVNRTILGMNGNTPIAISILTTGEVKCMTQITGSVELSTAYKLN